MTLAVILGRVSTEDQAEDGTGLTGQIEAGLRHIELKEYTLDTSVGFASDGLEYVPGVFQEDFSGKVIYRPAINHLLDALEARPINVVVIHRTSRLGRRGSVQEALESLFKERGARVEFVTAQFDTSTPTGRAMRRISGVFDELDYEQIIDQLKEGKIQRVKSGSIITTRPPYGYTVVKDRDEQGKKVTRLVIVEEEAEVVRTIYVWYVYGDEDGVPLSMHAIAKRLTEMRVSTRGDATPGIRRSFPKGMWSHSTVGHLLLNEVYAGRWYYGKRKVIQKGDKTTTVKTDRSEWLCVPVPPIVDEDVFEMARERAEYNSQMAKRNTRRNYLFKGMIRCGKCRGAYSGQTPINTGRQRYQCCNSYTRPIKRCDAPSSYEADIDAKVWPWIKDIAQHFDRVEAALRQRQEEADDQNARLFTLIANTDKLIAEKKAEQDRLLALYQKGKLIEERWEVADAECQQEIASHEEDREKLVAKLVNPHYTPEYLADVRAACARIAIGIEHFDEAQKRETYELLELSLVIEVQDGYRVAHAECILGKKLLMIGRSGSIASEVR